MQQHSIWTSKYYRIYPEQIPVAFSSSSVGGEKSVWAFTAPFVSRLNVSAAC